MRYDVLVVDDEIGIRKLFASVLSRSGYTVTTAASGTEALTQLAGNTFGLVLLDLKMPEMDGTETLRRIRAEGATAPVYVVTAFEQHYITELRALKEDGIEFEVLNKPVENRHLLRVAEDVLGPPPDRAAEETPHMRLYVVDFNKRTEKLANSLHRMFQKKYADDYRVEVISVIDDPAMATRDGIFATPTLVRVSPQPPRRIFGNLTRPQQVFDNLGLP